MRYIKYLFLYSILFLCSTIYVMEPTTSTLFKQICSSISKMQDICGELYDNEYKNCISMIDQLKTYDISIDTMIDGITLLHRASATGNLNLIIFLLDFGANPTIRTESGLLSSELAIKHTLFRDAQWYDRKEKKHVTGITITFNRLKQAELSYREQEKLNKAQIDKK